MKVGAYQAPLLAPGSMAALPLIRERIDECESQGVEILCCPEAILGGLADDAPRPATFAIDVESGQLYEILAPLASDTVTTILGFTEIDAAGRLYNSAAVFHRGTVLGVYRKMHPAIRRSIYNAGDRALVFTAGNLTFGILLCFDSTFPEPAKAMAAQGAQVLFVPTNNGLPPAKTGPWIVDEARKCDIARATENGAFVVRADVAGRTADRVAYGCSEIVDPDGKVLVEAKRLQADWVVAEI